jgi:hypothetical protein
MVVFIATVRCFAQDASTSTTVRANPAVVLTADCGRAARGLVPVAAPEAIQICLAAMEAADRASTEPTYERRASRAFLADAYIAAQRWSDAIPIYQAAIEIANKGGGDSNSTHYLMGIAFAQANLGDLPAADRSAESAAGQMEAISAAATDPEERSIRARELRSIYALAMQIKRLRGDAAGAAALERKAAALGNPK